MINLKTNLALGEFRKFVTKIIHFRHISAKIQPKNLKLVHYYLLTVRGNISIGGPGPMAMPLLPLMQLFFRI